MPYMDGMGKGRETIEIKHNVPSDTEMLTQKECKNRLGLSKLFATIEYYDAVYRFEDIN